MAIEERLNNIQNLKIIYSSLCLIERMIVKMNEEKILLGQKKGSITIQVYRENNTNKTFFYLMSDSDSLLPIVDILEDTLKKY